MIGDVHTGSRMRILIFLLIPDPGSRGQKGTGSRGHKGTGSRLRNTVLKTFPGLRKFIHSSFFLDKFFFLAYDSFVDTVRNMLSNYVLRYFNNR